MISAEKIDAILFDLDGTLVDSDDAAVDRLAGRLQVLSWLRPRYDPVPLARWLIMQGEGPANAALTLLDVLGLDEAVTVLRNRLKRQRRGRAVDFRLIDGIPETLENLAHCYRLALVTSRSRRHIGEFRARHPEVARHLSALVSRQDTVRFKPHPAPLHLAARQLGVSIMRCLMVGDTSVDIRAARRAGAWSAGVLCGYGTADELTEAGAHLVLDSVTELGALLRC